MRYSLWDTRIGSQLGRFDSEEDALAFVRTLIATQPREQLSSLSLNWRDADGNVGEARTGEDVLARAEEVAADRERADAPRGHVVATRPRSRGGSRLGSGEMAAKEGYSGNASDPGRGTRRAVRRRSS